MKELVRILVGCFMVLLVIPTAIVVFAAVALEWLATWMLVAVQWCGEIADPGCDDNDRDQRRGSVR